MASFVTAAMGSTNGLLPIQFSMIQLPSVCLRSGDALFRRTGVIGVGINPSRKGKVVVMAKYKGTQKREMQLTEMIEVKVKEAKQVCEGDERSDECKVAWDEVEEVSQAKADLRFKLLQKHDPLESFCQDNPETDECRIYDA
ncbi:hypothetical protein Vadar_013452 [Vaccinium darrowii]|uniref:Uncharacterized protein n=1 Tax=Vaccinium darrowii TaxID=229202 RepID=A0ACB7Y0E4_9ERIC|nr:hypothetical protein Vadar_013452 [Vaccinium darrowii]